MTPSTLISKLKVLFKNIHDKINTNIHENINKYFLTNLQKMRAVAARKKTKAQLTNCQGGRGWLAFGDRSRIPQSFRRARICKFSRQKHRFLIAEKQAICGCQKTCTHTGTFPQTPFLMFRYVLWLCTGCTKALQKWALQKLYESRLYESSLKALRKLSESSLKAL